MPASPPTHRLSKSHASHSGGADPSAPTKGLPHIILSLSFRASAHTGVGIRIPAPAGAELPPPSVREVSTRSVDGGIVISRADRALAPTHAYRTRTLSLSCHSEPVTDVTGVGIRIPCPLPLPLGEVAERSEDGEGKQRRAASRRPFFQRVEKPILSFRGAPQGYLLRGAKRRRNPFPAPAGAELPASLCEGGGAKRRRERR